MYSISEPIIHAQQLITLNINVNSFVLLFSYPSSCIILKQVPDIRFYLYTFLCIESSRKQALFKYNHNIIIFNKFNKFLDIITKVVTVQKVIPKYQKT